MQYIDIYSKESDRRSSLAVKGNSLQVTGNLPHGYTFQPATPQDAIAMIQYLEQWLTSQQ